MIGSEYMNDIGIHAADTYLIEMFFERNAGAINETDLKYHQLLSSVILTILGNREDTEECLNDVYMKLWNSIPPNRPQSFRAYAISIARNTAMSIIRAKKAQKREAICFSEPLDPANTGTLDNEVCDYEESSKIREIINSYLASAGERKMYIFMSRYYFDKPIYEIAKKLHCSESTVNKEIKKIKTELKKKLEEGGIYV